MKLAMNGKEFDVATGGTVNVLNGTPLEIREDGPLTMLWDGAIRQERNPPFFVGGDNGQPLPWAPGAGSYRLDVIQGPAQVLTTVTVKVTEPVRWEKIGPADQDGPTNKSLASVWVTGRNQNVNINADGTFTFDEVVSELAWDDRPTTPGAVTPSMFRGQGGYGEGNNILIFRGCYFGQNGWPGVDGRGLARKKQKDIFHHGGYINKGIRVRYEDCYFDRNCSMGAKVMRDAEFVRCLFHENSIAIQAIYGSCLVDDCTFYRGAYSWDGSSWTGNGIGDLYCPTTFRNSLIVAGPASTLVDTTGDTVSNNGAIKINRKHNQYTDVVGGSVTIANTVLRGWNLAGQPDGIGGDNDKPGNVSGAFTIDNRGPLSMVLPDPRLELVAGSTVTDMVRRHVKLVRSAAA
jgi:hypothetical protein